MVFFGENFARVSGQLQYLFIRCDFFKKYQYLIYLYCFKALFTPNLFTNNIYNRKIQLQTLRAHISITLKHKCLNLLFCTVLYLQIITSTCTQFIQMNSTKNNNNQIQNVIGFVSNKIQSNMIHSFIYFHPNMLQQQLLPPVLLYWIIMLMIT